MKVKEQVQEYLKMPYTRIIQEINDDDQHYFYGKILELDGCQSTGDTLEELYESLNEAMVGYIETKIENNQEVPYPIREEKYSGKFLLRLPKSLHMKLVIEAEKEGISLNQYALYKLAR